MNEWWFATHKLLKKISRLVTTGIFFIALEEKLSLVMDQLDLAQQQLVEAEERANKAENDGNFLILDIEHTI